MTSGDERPRTRWGALVALVGVAAGAAWWFLAGPGARHAAEPAPVVAAEPLAPLPPPLPEVPEASRDGVVLLITVDTLRTERLPTYGATDVETPALDRFAAESVLFEHALAPAPVTLPSHATMLSGLLPLHHGARDNGYFVLPDEVETLTERLGEAGLVTAAVVSAGVLGKATGLAQGFDRYLVPAAQRTADETTDLALGLLERHGWDGLFLWVHYWDPHAPWSPPEPFASTYEGRPYDGEIAFTDREIGRLIDGLRAHGAWDDAVVVFAGDHGESLGDHGELQHGVFLYDATIRVPLWIKAPGLRAGTRVEELVALADLMPTLVELLELPASDTTTATDGLSLVPALRDGAAVSDAGRVHLLQTLHPQLYHGWSALDAVRRGPLKYIRAPRPELYDLSQDPGELANLVEQRSAEAAELAAILDELTAGDEGAAGVAAMDPAVEERLASLGYVVAERGADGELPDPKDGIHEMEKQDVALHTMMSSPAEALPMLREITDEHPRGLFMREALIFALRETGKDEEAAQVARDGLALSPGSVSLAMRLAQIHLDAGRFDEEARVLEALLATGEPHVLRDAKVHEALGRARELAGDAAGAEAAYRDALDVDPADGEVRAKLGTLFLRQGRQVEARALLASAVEAGVDTPDLHSNLGLASASLGDPAAAEAAYRRALELDPAHRSAGLNLALLLARAGRHAEALPFAERVAESDPADPRYRALVQQLRADVAASRGG